MGVISLNTNVHFSSQHKEYLSVSFSTQEIKPAKNELHYIFSNISIYIPRQRHKRLGRTNYLIYLFIWEPPRLFCVCRFYYSISSVACLRGRLLLSSYAASIYQVLLLLLFMGHLLYFPNFVLKEIWNDRSPKVIIRTRTIHTQHPFLPTTTTKHWAGRCCRYFLCCCCRCRLLWKTCGEIEQLSIVWNVFW